MYGQFPGLQLRLPQSSTIKLSPLIILFRHCQGRQLLGHDPSRTSSGDNRVFGEIRYTIILAQEVFVEFKKTIDGFCWCV